MLFVVKCKGIVVLNWTFAKTWIEIYRAPRAASRKYGAMTVAVLCIKCLGRMLQGAFCREFEKLLL